MIYLITGLPGNGKTLYALWWVHAKALKEGRPVFYSGIKGLTLPWTEIDGDKWFDCPANAIVVIDECQRLFGVRGRGAPIPRHATELETHRHLGIDLVMITQSPMLLDNHDRSLMATHFHVVRNFGLNRATVYEFQQCKDNVLKSRAGGIRHEWRYPKEAFSWYQSAEVHTHKARIPMRVWLLLSLPFIIVAVCWFIYARWNAKIHGDDLKPGPPGSPSSLVATAERAPAAGRDRRPKTPAEYAQDFAPRIAGLAYTAPVYDEVTKPMQAPIPAACVQSKKRCQCYTQQGTRLEVPTKMCQDITAGGFFVAWDQPAAKAIPQAPMSVPQVLPAMAGSFGGTRGSSVASAAPPRYEGTVDNDPARPRPRPVGF